MPWDAEIRRRALLPLLGGLLLAGYVFGFAPLQRKAEKLDGPLQQSWQKLANLLGQTNASALDFASLTNQLTELQAAAVIFTNTWQQAALRVELDEELQAQLRAPFQLVDYENESGRLLAVLGQLARDRKVTLETPVFTGFPAQTADMREPALLWAEQAFIESLLMTAINARVTVIHSVTALAPLTNSPPPDTGLTLTELPIQLELTGPVANVQRFLQTLPLRASEIKAAGLPEAPARKPALFVERLLLRKQTPERPDEVRLSLRAVGFVLRDGREKR